MNIEISRTSDPHGLLLSLTDIINLRRKDKYIALSNLNIYYTWKNLKSHIKIINLKYQLQHGKKNLNYLIDDNLYQIHDYFEYILKKHGEKTLNPSIKIYTNKIKNRILFKIKTGYYPELLTPQTLKLL